MRAIDVIESRCSDNDDDDDSIRTRIDAKEENISTPVELIKLMRTAWFESFNMVFGEYCDMEDSLGGRFGRGNSLDMETMAMEIINKHGTHK